MAHAIASALFTGHGTRMGRNTPPDTEGMETMRYPCTRPRDLGRSTPPDIEGMETASRSPTRCSASCRSIPPDIEGMETVSGARLSVRGGWRRPRHKRDPSAERGLHSVAEKLGETFEYATTIEGRERAVYGLSRQKWRSQTNAP
jgi:hypothetical protein